MDFFAAQCLHIFRRAPCILCAYRNTVMHKITCAALLCKAIVPQTFEDEIFVSLNSLYFSVGSGFVLGRIPWCYIVYNCTSSIVAAKLPARGK